MESVSVIFIPVISQRVAERRSVYGRYSSARLFLHENLHLAGKAFLFWEPFIKQNQAE